MAKLLLVEDDISLREIYAARLQAEGHQVVVASDGEEALAIAVKEKPDLVVCDVMMPKISGFDVLDILRSTPETKHAKIIMMTALSQQSDRERGERLGADRYLVKSQVTLEDVVNTVNELLSQTEQAASTMVANNVQSSTAGNTSSQVQAKEGKNMDPANTPTDNNDAADSPAAPQPNMSAPATGSDSAAPAADSGAAPVSNPSMPANLDVTEPGAAPATDAGQSVPMPSEPPAEPPAADDEPEAPAAGNPQTPQPGETVMPGNNNDAGTANPAV